MRVSVVVPVYNPGAALDACVESVLGQSLPDDEYEAIFVDDASTDGTAERLDALAREHQHVRVIHAEGSGGPGRPRNLGTAAATGEFVYFLDHDDWLGPQALERLYATATRAGADIVVGKVVGHGRGVAKQVFRQSTDDARLLEDGLLGLLTPHKLFRASFLAEHKLAFVEGPQYLEDHLFVVAAYFRAKTVTVLADYPCCHWMRGEANFSMRRLNAVSYFRAVRDVLDIVDANTEPGERRDRIYAHWLHGKLVRRFAGDRAAVNLMRQQRGGLYREIRKLVLERFPPSVDRWLPMPSRVRAALVRANARWELAQLAAADHGLTAVPELRDLRWADGLLVVAGSMRLTYAGSRPVGLRRNGSRVAWAPPVRIPARLLADAADVTDELDGARLDLYLRYRENRADFCVPMGTGLESVEQLVLSGETVIDERTAQAGSPLDRGIWDLELRADACGWSIPRRLGRDGHALPEPAAAAGTRRVEPYWTGKGNLSLRVDR